MKPPSDGEDDPLINDEDDEDLTKDNPSGSETEDESLPYVLALLEQPARSKDVEMDGEVASGKEKTPGTGHK